jgi:hypothetical protein
MLFSSKFFISCQSLTDCILRAEPAGYFIQWDGQAGLFCYSLFETQNKKRVKRSAYSENPQSVLHSPE